MNLFVTIMPYGMDAQLYIFLSCKFSYEFKINELFSPAGLAPKVLYKKFIKINAYWTITAIQLEQQWNFRPIFFVRRLSLNF